MTSTAFHPDERHPAIYAQRAPDRPAVIMADTGQTITFAQYESLSNQCAHLLRKCGLKRGDRVVILMENNIHFLPLAWGGFRAGLRVTAVATHLGPEEIDYILNDSGADVLLTSRAMAHSVGVLSRNRGPAHRYMVDGIIDGFESLEQALEVQPHTPIDDQSEGVEMLYSSGTTGRPKAVLKRLPETPYGVPTAWHHQNAQTYGFNEKTIYLSPAPLYHAAPLMANIRVTRYGGTCVVMKKFDAQRALELIEQYKVTASQWVPTHFVRLLRLPDEIRQRHDLSSHLIAIHAAAPCPVQIKQQMIDWWGPILFEYYAGSEGNGYVCITSEQWLKKPGSVGVATVGNLRICDDDGNEVPAGTEGTVYFEGGPVFEYHNDPDKTAGSRQKDGWSTLGDVGYVDEDGYLFLTDRKAFTIVSGGVNIYPQEAENCLIMHPAVADVAVFGVPNADFGEEVKAVVQPANGIVADEHLGQQLIAYCKEHLSHVKCPRSVDFIDVMPREENGKLYKRKLRDAYRDNPGAGHSNLA